MKRYLRHDGTLIAVQWLHKNCQFIQESISTLHSFQNTNISVVRGTTAGKERVGIKTENSVNSNGGLLRILYSNKTQKFFLGIVCNFPHHFILNICMYVIQLWKCKVFLALPVLVMSLIPFVCYSSVFCQPSNWILTKQMKSMTVTDGDIDQECEPCMYSTSGEPYLIRHSELNDLVRDSGL